MGTRALKTAPLAIVVLEREVPRRIEMGMTWIAHACTKNILL